MKPEKETGYKKGAGKKEIEALWRGSEKWPKINDVKLQAPKKQTSKD